MFKRNLGDPDPPYDERRAIAIWGSRGGVWGGVVGGWQTLEVGVLEVGRLDVGGWLVGGVGDWRQLL